MSESKKGRYIGAGIVLIILIALFLEMQGYLSHRVDPGTTDLQKNRVGDLKQVIVEGRSIEEFESAVGTVTSQKETLIASKIPAHVQQILVAPGTRVKADTLLIRLDDRDLKAKLGQAKSGHEAAKAAKTQAESAYKRYQNLIKTGAATQAEFEQIEAQYQMAAANVNEAGNAVQELNVMLGYTEIRAPYSGIVVEKLINEGAFAGPGMPLIRLEDPEKLRLEVFVPESRRKSVSVGKTFMVRIDTLKKEIPGKVDEIVPSSDPRSRSFLVRMSLDAQSDLNSGMFGRCYFPIERKNVVLVNPGAVYNVGQLEMVQVVENDELKTRLVRTGIKREGMLEILSGLKPGEVVVLMEHTED